MSALKINTQSLPDKKEINSPTSYTPSDGDNAPKPPPNIITTVDQLPQMSSIDKQALMQQRNAKSSNPPNKKKQQSFFASMFCCCFQTEDEQDAYVDSTNSKNKKEINSQTSQEKSDRTWLLPPLASEDVGKKCLVLDLDETLVHSSFKPVANSDFIIPVEIDNQIHNVYVLKRPGVDDFLQRLGPQFEVVVFTASLSKYADPVLDILDKSKAVKHRLFRESCIHHKGNYVKDLSQLGRDLKDTIIIDNSPASYVFHPTNAIPISSWFNDPNDTELYDLVPFLEDLKMVENVMTVLDNSND